MRKIAGYIFSLTLSGILLLTFAFAIAYATFIENDYGTETARALVYKAKWFEFLLLLLAVNMTGSIFVNKMYKREKWTILLFHVAFLVIFIGAAITRYIGFEGMMSIREGAASGKMISDENFIQVRFGDEMTGQEKFYRVLFTPVGKNRFHKNIKTSSGKVDIKLIEFIPDAAQTLQQDPDGKPIISLVLSAGKAGMMSRFLSYGDSLTYNNTRFYFGDGKDTAAVHLRLIDGTLVFSSPSPVQITDMMAGTSHAIAPDSIVPLTVKSLYKSENVNFVVSQFEKKGKLILVRGTGKENADGLDALRLEVSSGNDTREIIVTGKGGVMPKREKIQLGQWDLSIGYGPRIISLPFEVRLNDFQLERYPGSNSPSSYASEVTVIDPEKGREFPYRIYMNNVLNYRGYRFFQSSYDKDEQGTILSVNHDWWGTVFTYAGYFLLTLGMCATLFNNHSRFRSLIRTSARLRYSRSTLKTAILLMALGWLTFSGRAEGQEALTIKPVDKNHADSFGKLLVQDKDGRIKPVNTLASELVRKLSRKSKFMEQTPEQVFLGMLSSPEIWQNTPMIKVTHPELKNFIGVTGNYATFAQIVDVKTGGYILADYVEVAYRKKPAERNKFDKDLMAVDERVNIAYLIYTGNFMTIFPVPNHPESKWVNAEGSEGQFEGDAAVFVKSSLQMYFEEVEKAQESGDWKQAGEFLSYLIQFQQKYGSDLIPAGGKQRLEIFYNNSRLFNRLSAYYGMIGFILLVIHFINILRPAIRLRKVIMVASVLVLILFLIHTAGLAIRWYISGHAPWSNGYESMIYIGWATILAGLAFVRRSEITLSVTALLTSVILSVAAMSWMDPEITNLVPVLKSYWLVIHVAIITASYGFLGLGALLGFLNLIFMILRTRKNMIRLDATVAELVCIIEMTLIAGLFLLTVGTFLGGVWANESWGRYWGWDPKETWALVTILIYSFVLHMRFIPGFKGHFALSFASLISYGSVMMTYFGVNYYLSGLHSYAKGDPVPVPSFVYYTVAVVLIAAILAYISEFRTRNYAPVVPGPDMGD